MIECDTCGRRHREEKQLEACRVRAEKASDRLAKVEAEAERRRQNQGLYPWQDFVSDRRHRDGWPFEKIAAVLKREYPKGTPTDIYGIVAEYARGLDWPVPLERRITMLLDRHYTGHFITEHPMQAAACQMYHGTDVWEPHQVQLAWDAGRVQGYTEEIED